MLPLEVACWLTVCAAMGTGCMRFFLVPGARAMAGVAPAVDRSGLHVPVRQRLVENEAGRILHGPVPSEPEVRRDVLSNLFRSGCSHRVVHGGGCARVASGAGGVRQRKEVVLAKCDTCATAIRFSSLSAVVVPVSVGGERHGAGGLSFGDHTALVARRHRGRPTSGRHAARKNHEGGEVVKQARDAAVRV